MDKQQYSGTLRYRRTVIVPDWSQAACAGMISDWFYGDCGASTKEAKAVCASCAIRLECLEYALRNCEKFGIWGGTSERERRRLRKSN